jgi:hypothetical protein
VPGDQEPGDDEEDIDADKSPGQPAGLQVVDHHEEHGQGAQGLDFGQELAPLRLGSGLLSPGFGGLSGQFRHRQPI